MACLQVKKREREEEENQFPRIFSVSVSQQDAPQPLSSLIQRAEKEMSITPPPPPPFLLLRSDDAIGIFCVPPSLLSERKQKKNKNKKRVCSRVLLHGTCS